MTGKRLVGGFVLPAALVGIAFVPYLALRDRLPDPLATHWDLSGAPDGSMSSTAMLLFVGLLTGLGALGLVFLAVAPAMTAGVRGVFAWASGFTASLFAGISVLTVVANLDIADWERARDPGWLKVIGMCVLAVGVGALASYLLRRDDDLSVVHDPSRLPSAGLQAGDRVTWLGGCRSRWMLALGAVLMVVAAVGGMLTGPFFGASMAVGAFATMMFGSIRVATNQRGLTVWYTPLAWPRTEVPLDRIVAAEAIEVSPMKHGGWGYRGSLKLFGVAAVVLRKGEGIRLELDDGKLFVVTVDDAQTGAGVLNDLLGLSTPT